MDKVIFQNDMDTKVAYLRDQVGKEFSDNLSSTLRCKLLAVSESMQHCTVIEIPNWGKEPKHANPKCLPNWYVFNCFAGV
jgi:hypothetical protein